LSKYKTVTEFVEVETPPSKGSRFIGFANHTPTIDSAVAFIESVKSKHPRASHHTFAWLVDSQTSRVSDDGEPKGTAGRPIFDRIKGLGLSQTTVVVVRYYGGTKLGTGGLVRAYGSAASAVLEAALIIEKEVLHTISLTCPYELEGPIRGAIKEHKGEITEINWSDNVSLKIGVTKKLQLDLKSSLSELGAGKITFE